MRNNLIGSLAIGTLATCVLGGFGSEAFGGAARSVRVGDIRMGYRVHGSGDPLVLIMGYGSTMNLWEPELIRMLSSRYTVILFDNRGMGKSEAGRSAFTIGQFADDTAGLMDALGIPRAHLLGWSMGGLIAEEVALRHPAKVNKLVLYAAHCDAGLFPPPPEVLRKLTDRSGTPEEQGMRFISLLFPSEWLESHSERVREVFFRPMGTIPPETLVQQSRAIGAWKGACDRLGGITSPTLVIAGADDLLVPSRNARYLAGAIPGAELVLKENSGHGLMFQHPLWFSEAVCGFLHQPISP